MTVKNFILIPKQCKDVDITVGMLGKGQALITVADKTGAYDNVTASILVTRRKRKMWDTLLLEYGPEQAEGVLSSLNFLVAQMEDGTAQLLELSTEPFVHSKASIAAMHDEIVRHASAHARSVTKGIQEIIVKTIPVRCPSGSEGVEAAEDTLIVDLVCKWSAFQPHLTLSGALRASEEFPGIGLTYEKSVMKLPLINRWEENLRLGVRLMSERYVGMIEGVLERCSTSRASLLECDRIRELAEKAGSILEQSTGARLTSKNRSYCAIGQQLFDYGMYLDHVYDLEALASHQDADTVKYFAPSHISRTNAVRYLLGMAFMGDSTSVVQRQVNSLLFSGGRNETLQAA